MLEILLLSAFFFVSLLVLVTHAAERDKTLKRTHMDWLVDGIGLLLQGVFVPGLALVIGFLLLPWLLPSYTGRIELGAVWTFLLALAGVDYLYYWNHRLLHSPGLWPWHRCHHSSSHVDIFATARGSLGSPLAFVYLWSYALALWLLHDPAPYLLGAVLTSCLDLWRHWGPGVGRLGVWERRLGRVLITPRQHAHHHEPRGQSSNFGANFSLWDRLHGTLGQAPTELRLPPPMRASRLLQEFLYPLFPDKS